MHKHYGLKGLLLVPIAVWGIFFVLPVVLAAESQTSPPPGAANSTTLDFANGLYVRKMYGPAISEYEKFIQANPGSPEVPSAQFRLADSYYFSKNQKKSLAF